MAEPGRCESRCARGSDLDVAPLGTCVEAGVARPGDREGIRVAACDP